jgi:DNA-binding CsgD family transcriptional regulator
MLEKFSRVVMDLHRASKEHPVTSFQDAAFGCLQTAIDFDSAVWLTSVIHPDRDAAAFHTRHFYRQPPQLLDDWMKCEGATVFPRKLFASPNVAFLCTPFTDMVPEVAAHCRRYGIEQILTIAQVEPIARMNELISLYRANSDKPFSEEERLFQQAIVPHLAETWRINRMLHLSHTSQSYTAMLRSAAADAQGILHVIEPGFIRLLQEEWPDWRGPCLPDELAREIENGGGQFFGNQIVVRISSLHDQFLLRGRNKTLIDTLSPRKCEVAKLFSTGSTHKEIAAMLDLSPATVRNYLNSVYITLGIGSKAKLVNLLRDYNQLL